MTELIGERVAYWRGRRGKSQRVLAGLAGLSQPYLSQIERGLRTAERRSTLVALADALEVSVAELTGQAGDPTDPARARAAAAVPDIREAIIMRETGEVGETSGDLAALMAARSRYDFAAAAPMVPGLLAGATGGELVQVATVAESVLRHLGYIDLAREAGRLAVLGAEQADDPAWLGTAERRRVACFPPESAAGPVLARRAADKIQPRCADERTRRAYGMLHLEAALRSATLGREDDARDHLQEAERVAATVPEPSDWDDLAQHCFGPTNVAMWRATILAELGNPQEATRAAESVNPDVIPFRHRRAAWWVDRMTMAAAARRDSDAVTAFLRAESEAPQYVRIRPIARDTIRVIWRRTRQAAVPPPLRRAAAMVGLHE